MLFIDFPITGSLRVPLILIEWIFIFLCLELGLSYIMKYKNAPKNSKNIQELSYASLFLAYSLQWFWFIFSDYYAPNAQSRTIFLTLGYLSLMAGGFLFIFTMEKNKIFLKKYLFSVLYLAVIVAFLLIIVININLAQFFSFFPFPVFVLFFTFYLIDLAKNYSNTGEVAKTFIQFSIGFILLGLGFTLTTDYMTLRFGLEIKLIGDLLQIIAISFIYIFFSKLPPLIEFDWYNKIESVFLLEKSGLCLFAKNLIDEADEDEENVDKNVLTGIASGLNTFLETLTDNQGITVIKKENKKVIIYPSELFTGVIISQQDLISIEKLLIRFVERVESIYKSMIGEWDGNLEVFDPINRIFNNIFRKD